ncbi:helix-turn-helix transcriptional regulator [Candidatus Bathyarchaeota archaeon]|nr:helix-turn-helix transcriptional regulator [Candidatus Bathyarchaeota archaeon]
MQHQSDNFTRVYALLADPVRRRIIGILSEKRKAGFEDIRDVLKIRARELLGHLDSLDGLVGQGPDKMYFLTDQGQTALSSLNVAEKVISGGMTSSPVESRTGLVARELLFGRTLMNHLSQSPAKSLPITVVALFVGGLISFKTNLEPILLFYLNPTPGIGQIWFLLMFPLGSIITFGVADLLCYLFFKKRGGELSLLNGTAVAMLPLLLVPGLVLLIEPFSAIVRATTSFTILIQIAVQIWVVCLLSSAISVAKGLRMERTALVSLAVMYLNVTTVFFALQLGLF